MKKNGCGVLIAFLLVVAPLAAQDAEEMGLRIEILDVHTGRHFTLDPNSDFNVQGAAAFSVDKQWVVFHAIRKGDARSATRLMLAKVDGSQKLPTDLGGGLMPSFSRDGKQIAYSDPKGRGVWFMNADGKDKQLIDQRAWSIVFSPHDNDVVAYMAWTSDGPSLKIHNLESGEERFLLSEEAHEQYRMVIQNFQWSADGSKIVFCARPRHENSQKNSPSDAVIATIGTGDEPKIEVVAVEAANDRVVFHPTTNEIFFSKRTPSKGTHRIFSVNPQVPQKFRSPDYLVNQPDERWNMICDFSSDGNLAAIASKITPAEVAIDAEQLDQRARTVQVVIAKLKLARTFLRQGKYEAFVDELMGDLDKGDREVAADGVEQDANLWLGTVNYALGRTDRAKVTEESVSFGTGKYGRDLRFVENDGWELETTDLP